MRRTIVGLALAGGLLAAPAGASAADWFVRPNGTTYGNGTGTSWTNAFSGFAAIPWGTVGCGDTVWAAGGTYTQDLEPAKTCTPAARVAVRRARADAPAVTASPGWHAGFDSTVHQAGAGIGLLGNWDGITISGRTTAAGGGHGWWIDLRGLTQGTGISFANGATADDNVFEYIDLQGPGAINYTGDGRGIDATPFASATGNLFSHLRIFDWESAISHVGMNGSTFEHLDVFDIMAANWPTFHPNGLYTSASQNVTVRYSTFRKGPHGHGVGEGIFFEQGGGAANWSIYGNVFHDLDSIGLKAIQITSAVPGLRIANNTFDNVAVPGVFVNGGSCGAGSESRNNLSFATPAPAACGVSSNNLTLASTPMPFLDRGAHDYRIVAAVGAGYPRNGGVSMAGLFTADRNGAVFGADGAWDVGATEYGSTPPAPPGGTPPGSAGPAAAAKRLGLGLRVAAPAMVGRWTVVRVTVTNRTGRTAGGVVVRIVPPRTVIARRRVRTIGTIGPGRSRTFAVRLKARSAVGLRVPIRFGVTSTLPGRSVRVALGAVPVAR